MLSGISLYDDSRDATSRFDFVLANPPFKVNAVDKERLKDMVGPGRRFHFGPARADIATGESAATPLALVPCAMRTQGRR